MVTDKLTFTVEEAGKLLGISRATAFLMAKSGNLPILQMGRRKLVPKIALEKMLSEVKPSAKN